MSSAPRPAPTRSRAHRLAPRHQQRRRRILVLAASLLVLFGCVVELTEVLYDNGRVTYLVFGALLIGVGTLGLVWSVADRRRLEAPGPLAEVDRE